MTRGGTIGASSLALVLASAGLTGCVADRLDPMPPPSPVAVADRGGYTITSAELDQLTNSFADTYVSRMISACDHVADLATSPEVRADAQYLKILSAVSAYDIATGLDPYSQLLDLTTMTLLQHIVWVEEGGAASRFGALSPAIIDALERSRAEMNALAGRVLKPDQLLLLEQQAREWRSRNPEIRFVSLVRFNDAASERARSILADVRRGTGFLAPVSEAVDNLDRARKFAERAFFLSKRLPLIVGWQADDTVSRVLAKQEVQDALALLSRSATALDESVALLRALPESFDDERKALFVDLDARQKSVDQTLARLEVALASGAQIVDGINDPAGSVKQLLEQTEKTSASLQQTLAGVDRILGRFDTSSPDAPEGAKFGDVQSYSELADRFTTTAHELNTLVRSSTDLLGSPAWTTRLREVNAAATERVEHATNRGRELTDYVFRRAVYLIGIALLAAMAYRVFSLLIDRRPARKPG